jgi:hypothetical protein
VGGEHLMRAAAAIAAIPGATLSHESAAQLYNIDLLGSPGLAVTLTCRPERGTGAGTGSGCMPRRCPPSTSIRRGTGFPDNGGQDSR